MIPLICSTGELGRIGHPKLFSEWAQSRPGVEYRPIDNRFVRRFLGAPFDDNYRDGHFPVCLNVTSGRDSGPAFVHLDYYQPPDSLYSTCVVAVALPHQFPDLTLEPYLHVGEYHLEPQSELQTEFEAFNRRFQISAPDERAAHGMLSPLVIERLLSLPPGVTVRVERADILCYRRRHPFLLREFVEVLSTLAEISRLLPEFLAIS